VLCACAVSCVLCAACCVRCAVCGVRCAACLCAVCCAVCCVLRAVCRVPSAECCVLCAVCGLLCVLCPISDGAVKSHMMMIIYFFAVSCLKDDRIRLQSTFPFFVFHRGLRWVFHMVLRAACRVLMSDFRLGFKVPHDND
jgi:hypothetical protein